MRGKKSTTKSKQQTKKRKSSGQQNRSSKGRNSQQRRRGPVIEIPAILEPDSDDTITETAGQAGDIEGLTSVAIDDSESVRELVEEGQDFEAELVDGMEN